MPAEYRRAVVTAARIAAGQLPAVLPEPTPQRGLAGLCERVGADAHHPMAAVRAILAVFVEEIEALRRPAVPAESPTLGFTHLQFEAMLTAARQSANPCDFALVAMLGLLGLRIFEATSADIADLGEEHGHRVLRVCGKGSKVVQVPLPPAVSRAIDRAAGTAARSCSTAAAPGWTAMRRPAA